MTAWLHVSTRSDGVLVAPEGPLVEMSCAENPNSFFPGTAALPIPRERARILRSPAQRVDGGDDRRRRRAGADLLRIR